MKSIKNVLALSAIASSLLIAGVANAQSIATQPVNPAAIGLGAVTISNQIAGNVALNGAGSSESAAKNAQSATATLTTVTQTANNAAAAGVYGATSTTGSGQAWNYSTGNGVGSALSQGQAGAAVLGITAVQGPTVVGIPLGGIAAGGYSGAGTHDAISASTNMGGVSSTASSTNFGITTGISTPGSAVAWGNNDNTTTTNGISISDSKTGDASVQAATGTVNLNTGVDANGHAITTTLGSAPVTVGGAGSFGAQAAGAGIVANASGTPTAISQAIVPGGIQLIGSGVANGISTVAGALPKL